MKIIAIAAKPNIPALERDKIRAIIIVVSAKNKNKFLPFSIELRKTERERLEKGRGNFALTRLALASKVPTVRNMAIEM